MRLTKQNAAEYVGKVLMLNGKARFHYYPLTVGQWKNGEYFYKDANGVCMDVPDETDRFNAVYFDYCTT